MLYLRGFMDTNMSEPAPKKTKGQPIWELVIQDMFKRNMVGIEKYGTPLQAFNGRNSLLDAYQEVLDLVVYLRQHLEERQVMAKVVTAALLYVKFQTPDNLKLLEEAVGEYELAQ